MTGEIFIRGPSTLLGTGVGRRMPTGVEEDRG